MSLLERKQVKSERAVELLPVEGADTALLIREELRSQQNQEGVGWGGGWGVNIFGFSHTDGWSDWGFEPNPMRG
jgi:hypothetical protein